MNADSGLSDDWRAVFDVLNQSGPELPWVEAVDAIGEATNMDDVRFIGFDTNAVKLLRRNQSDRESILNYIDSKSISLVIPSQVVHEYWNNHAKFVKPLDSLSKALESARNEVSSLTNGSEFADRLGELQNEIERLSFEARELKDPVLRNESAAMWKRLLDYGQVYQVPRNAFYELGFRRMAVKTAPGFEDAKKASNQLGDFFAWADFLLGVKSAFANSSVSAENPVAVWVSNDAKPDWNAGGFAHPSLFAEMFAVTGVRLRIESFESVKKLFQ